jgi:hypothetical protein
MAVNLLLWRLGVAPPYKAANNICAFMRPHTLLREDKLSAPPVDLFRAQIPYDVWESGIVL